MLFFKSFLIIIISYTYNTYNNTNHKNYNFLACDWFKIVLFSTNSLAKFLSDSLLLDSLLSDSLISQSHSKMQSKSTNHIQSCNYVCVRARCCFCAFALDLRDVYASFVSILRCLHRVLRARAPMMRALVMCERQLTQAHAKQRTTQQYSSNYSSEIQAEKPFKRKRKGNDLDGKVLCVF